MIRLPMFGRFCLLLSFIWLAACDGGASDSDGAPVITSFVASTPRTDAGREVELTWSVSGADRLLLLPDRIDVTGQTRFVVTVDATGGFGLEASNAIGSRTATTLVSVYDWTGVGNTLATAVSDGTVNGASFALVDRAGALYTESSGNILLNQPVDLASASKLPTVMAILTLVDSGQLELDRPVAQYLALDSDFVWPAEKAAITMRMLLAHTAGIVGLGDEQPACLAAEFLSTLRDCAQVIADTTLVAAPGSAFNYGGADMQVAAYIATLLSGRNWQEFFEARIGTPLDLGPFLSYGDPGLVSNPRVAGGATATAPAYSRLLRVLLDGGLYEGQRVLSTAMIGEILRNQTAGLPVLFEPFPDGREPDYPDYGLGVFISAPRLHAGSNGPEFSDPGLFGATPWIDVGLGYGAVLLIENSTDTGLDLWDALRPQIITQIVGR